MQNENILIGSHEVKLTERRNVVISGVKKITNFDSEEFLVNTSMGLLLIKGESLELIKLDTNDGNLKIKGKINSLTYVEEKKKTDESLLSKLFK